MLCTVDDEICKAFAIWCWGTLFLKYSTIFLGTHSQIGLVHEKPKKSHDILKQQFPSLEKKYLVLLIPAAFKFKMR